MRLIMRYGVATICLCLFALSFAVARAEGEPEAYYTEAQAARGYTLFEKHCASCHSAESDPAKVKAQNRGFVLGRVKSVNTLGGTTLMDARRPRVPEGRRIYSTVYYL